MTNNKYGMKVARPLSSIEDKKTTSVSLSSSSVGFNVYRQGRVSIPAGGSVEIPHGLGYEPAFLVWRLGTADYSFLDGSTYSGAFFPGTGYEHLWISNHLSTVALTDKDKLKITGTSGQNFVYYIFANRASDIDGSFPPGTKDHGLKVSMPGVNAEGDNDSRFSFSSRFRTLKVDSGMGIAATTTSLAVLNLTIDDGPGSTAETGTYIDIFHDLGYPPLYMVVPNEFTNTYETGEFGPSGIAQSKVTWCDRNRIRLTYYQKAYYGGLYGSTSGGTTTFKLIIFQEDLSLVG